MQDLHNRQDLHRRDLRGFQDNGQLSHIGQEAHIGQETLEELMSWFHASSDQLTQEYRRLEERVSTLNRELEEKNTELRHSLREREEARGHLLSVLESTKAGVLVVDEALRPTLVNEQLRTMVGDVDADRAIQLIGERLATCLKQGERDCLPLESERLLHGPAGQTTPVHVVVSEILVSGAELRGYVLVFQDISRVKRLEAEANRAQRLAALGEMAASVAHEVRNPLGGIELYAGLLKEQDGTEVKRLATEILTAVQRLQTTISHLLSFASEPRITGEALPVAVLLKDVHDLAAPLFRNNACQFTLDIEQGIPQLWGDRGLLGQVLLNLVTNAVDAMPHGGRVRITARRAPFSTANGGIHREVEIRVVDQGVGIAAEDRERIFDPFFSTKATGTGLGLALSHKIIRAHTGVIEVTSNPSQGSCFTMFLPAADEGYATLSTPHITLLQKESLCESVLS